MTAPDPLAAVAALPGVAEAAARARDGVDALLWDRRVRARMAELTAQSRALGAWASAALDGADVPASSVRDGSALDGSPIGKVVAAAVRVQDETVRVADLLLTAPAQALARLHTVAAVDFVPDEDLGRPRRGERPDDPLRVGPAPGAEHARRRLTALGEVLRTSTSTPAVVVAGIAHGELLATRPFAWGTTLVARAVVRAVLAARGVDPDGAVAPEEGLRRLGRPAYVRALREYVSGTPEGVANWLDFNSRAILTGAEAARELLAAG